MKTESKVLNISEINNILKHDFKTKRLMDTGNCVGYTIKMERCFLPLKSQDATVSGSDLLAMLSKLNEWEKTIEEVRQGLLAIIEEQLPSSK